MRCRDLKECQRMKKKKSNRVKSLFNYTGNKYDLLDQLYSNFPKGKHVMLDLFCGGGSVFVNLEDKRFAKTYANDAITPLIEFFRYLQKEKFGVIKKELIKRKIYPKDKAEYLEIRNRFNLHGNFLDFFILSSSCHNNLIRFNRTGLFNQSWGRRGITDYTWKKMKVYHKKIYQNSRFVFLNEDFMNLQVPDDVTFVYLDPPYQVCEAGYNSTWEQKHEKYLYQFLDQLDSKGIKFLLSTMLNHKEKKNELNDKLENFFSKNIVSNYTKINRHKKPTNSQEVIVTNYETDPI
eukprot:Anaeramoba_ignava/a92107_32.p1 GENE.a92107_32~~a92107_32.p1  ORF type:complete len:334 (+),score=94.14 a92107_32:129-1004(+)